MAQYQYFAQPIENITTGSVVVYELLLRQWDDKNACWYVPENFDLSASLIIELLESAIKKLGNRRVSINLTYEQFADSEIEKAITTFAQKRMTNRQLTVELVNAPNLAILRAMSPVYRAAGIMIAIDDVGSDNIYKNVSDLLPYINIVKFALQNMRQDTTDIAMRLIESLNFWLMRAEEHRLVFIFEGIESEEDLKLANNLGVTRGQGYYFSRPMEPGEFVG